MEVKQMNDSFFCENEGHYFFYDASTGFMSETSRVFNDVISASDICNYNKWYTYK